MHTKAKITVSNFNVFIIIFVVPSVTLLYSKIKSICNTYLSMLYITILLIPSCYLSQVISFVYTIYFTTIHWYNLSMYRCILIYVYIQFLLQYYAAVIWTCVYSCLNFRIFRGKLVFFLYYFHMRCCCISTSREGQWGIK